MADLPHHGQTQNPTKTGHLSGDAADVGNRPAGARHHERCANSSASRKHHNDSQRLHAADPGQCHGRDELSDAGRFVEEAAEFRKNFRGNAPQCTPVSHGRICKCLKRMAPQVGLEPTTLRLTVAARRSVIVCDGLLSCWIAAWIRAIPRSLALRRFATVFEREGAQKWAQCTAPL